MRLLAFTLLLMAPSAKTFIVTVQTSGGITGGGSGGYTVASSGAVELAGVRGKKCPGLVAPKASLAKLREAIERAKPAQWKPSYRTPQNPNGCCDQITTGFQLTVGSEAPRATDWVDDSRGLLPADLAEVEQAAAAIAAALREKCR